MGSTVLAFILIILIVNLVQSSLKFKSLHCVGKAAEFISVEECRIRAINRTNNMINIRTTLKKTLTEITVNLKLLKRERGGWHPFLYDINFDFCKFQKSPNTYPFPKFIYQYIKDFTNINHTCPYLANNEMNILGWQINEINFISRLPIDFGEYALHSNWYAGRNLYFSLNGSTSYVD